MRAPKNLTPQYVDLAAFLAAQANPATAQAATGKKQSRTLSEWALDNRGRLTLAEAFASTFVWALALLALAFVPALAMAIRGRHDAPPAHAQPQVAVE